MDKKIKFCCSVCSCKKAKVLLEINKPDRFEMHVGITEINYSRKWLECINCGLAHNEISLENSNYLDKIRTSYYDVDFKNSSLFEKYQYVMALPENKSDNAYRVKRVIAFIKKINKGFFRNGKVLDIGAGTGVFLSRFIDEKSSIISP